MKLIIKGKSKIKSLLKTAPFYLFRLVPLHNKVVASSFKGQKYGDNPQYILEKLHDIDNKIDIVWLKELEHNYSVPSWMRVASWNLRLSSIYEIATAKVIIDTHRFQKEIRKRKGQLFIETWHGGLGIKKLDTDSPLYCNSKYINDEIATTNKLADVFISQSDHLSNIYRNTFGYKGPIWKCGYPKNDIFFTENRKIRDKVRQEFGLKDEHILLYAPSFRDSFYKVKEIDTTVYDVDFALLASSLQERFGGEWRIMVRWHPLFAEEIRKKKDIPSSVIDATLYPDMQELLLSADALLSDYSSCLFDAALREIPCFIFATDYETYKEGRGVYYELDELPFPYATNNKSLPEVIMRFDDIQYKNNLKNFFLQTGVVETGHASEDIARKINGYIKGEKIDWNTI